MLLYILVLFNTIISFIHIFELFKFYEIKKKLSSYEIKKKLNTKLKIDTDFWEGLDINDIFTDK